MGFFEQLLGSELGLPARAVVALLLVLGLIAITVWLIRRFGSGTGLKSAGGRGRQQRLAVLDSAVVDARRRLVLIRRDNVEHLLLIGGPTDVVVEPNIVRGAPLPAAAARLARPGVYDPTEGDYESSLIPYPEPAYEEPERPAPARAMPEAPRSAPRPAPRSEPHYSDMTSRMEAALRRPEPEIAPRPAPMAPRAAEPRLTTVAPPRPPAQRAQEPPPPRPAPPAPPQKSAADVFGNLEDEMASLLRPGGKSHQ